ncbi:hypothetical protein BU16DRAFT_544922 [Lophium mytilinum]|uniref:Uncharacterized protein n=1 Tax=Lophium mytilinum TaxID=390894 RepID=A0A6A6QAX8_9PEZI|nr:hypothetical protein BU16DRAFT_544922 [Lophium mytilinum]
MATVRAGSRSTGPKAPGGDKGLPFASTARLSGSCLFLGHGGAPSPHTCCTPTRWSLPLSHSWPGSPTDATSSRFATVGMNPTISPEQHLSGTDQATLAGRRGRIKQKRLQSLPDGLYLSSLGHVIAARPVAERGASSSRGGELAEELLASRARRRIAVADRLAGLRGGCSEGGCHTGSLEAGRRLLCWSRLSFTAPFRHGNRPVCNFAAGRPDVSLCALVASTPSPTAAQRYENSPNTAVSKQGDACRWSRPTSLADRCVESVQETPRIVCRDKPALAHSSESALAEGQHLQGLKQPAATPHASTGP